MQSGRLKLDGLRWHPSPNFTERRNSGRPALVVLHYTGMRDAEAARERLCDPNAEVSAHLLIDDRGQIEQLVDLRHRAWHAGAAGWANVDDVNSWSIGIELVNRGPLADLPPFPDVQMIALSQALDVIRAEWQIPPERIVGHSCVAPGRKIDPGPKFDWRRLSRRGHTVWADPPMSAGNGVVDAERFRAAARGFGFRVDDQQGWTDRLLDVWGAFALRFLAPSCVSAEAPFPDGVAHLEHLASRWPATALQPDES